MRAVAHYQWGACRRWTYGHLLPGQHAAATLPSRMNGSQYCHETLRATGTDGAAADDPDSMRERAWAALRHRTPLIWQKD